MKEKVLTITDKTIDKAIDYINGLNEEDFEKLIQEFADKQPYVVLYQGMINEEFKLEDGLLDAYIEISLIIYQSFIMKAGEIPVVSEKLISKILDDDFNRMGKMSAMLTGLDMNDPSSLKELNKISKNLNSLHDAKKLFEKRKMGSLEEFLTDYYNHFRQPYLFDFINDELDETDEEFDEEKVNIVTSSLLNIVTSFDEAVNGKKVVK